MSEIYYCIINGRKVARFKYFGDAQDFAIQYNCLLVVIERGNEFILGDYRKSR